MAAYCHFHGSDWVAGCVSCTACLPEKTMDKAMTPNSNVTDVRAAFEKWAKPKGYALHIRDMKGSTRLGEYGYADTQRLWIAWQAALSSAMPGWRPIGEAPKMTWLSCRSANGRYFCARLIARRWFDENNLIRDPVEWSPLPPLPERKG